MEVILTDPYLLLDTGEAGKPGGYEGAIAYLRALGLNPESEFRLKIPPSPKNASVQAAELFQRCISNAFPRATIDRFKNRCQFHDRFYLTRDAEGELKGVFGPSLNGLLASPVVIMGGITTDDLKCLAQWL